MEFELHLTMPRIQSLIQHTIGNPFCWRAHEYQMTKKTKQIFSRARFGAPGSDGLIAEVKSVEKNLKNRIRSSKYFPLLDRRRGGDCDFGGGATRRRTQGHKNHRAPKKMLREKNSRWWEFWQEARLRRGWFPTGSFFYRSQILRQIAPFLWIQRHTTENLWVITWKTAIILSFDLGIYDFFLLIF